MNVACITGLEQGASSRAECLGRCKNVEVSGVGVSQRRKKIATTLGTCQLTPKKSFGKRGRICEEAGVERTCRKYLHQARCVPGNGKK